MQVCTGDINADGKADLVAVGKGLGNGYPVSAIAMADDVADRLEAAGFHYAQSHQNDPLGCAVAVAVIDEMRARDLVPRSANLAWRFHQVRKPDGGAQLDGLNGYRA